MADYRITDLPAANAPLAGTEEQEVVQAGYSKRLSLNALWTWLAVQVQVLIDAAIAGSIDVGDAAGGDLAGAYPNPTLKPLVPSPAGSYSARDYTIVIDAKGRVLSMALDPIPGLEAVLYTPQTLTTGEQLIARGNIDAEQANTRLSAVSGLTMLDSLVIWDDDANAHVVGPVQGFMQGFLAAPNEAAAQTILGINAAGFIRTIGFAAVSRTVLNTESVIEVDLSLGDVTLTLPEIEPLIPDPAAPVRGQMYDIGIAGLANGNRVLLVSAVGQLISGEPDAEMTDDWDNMTIIAVVPAVGNPYWRLL